MKFTDRKLMGLKEPGDYLEQDGFILRIYESGKKVFQYRYSINGKRCRITIGEYPDVYTLAEARQKHGEYYRAVKRGDDPLKTIDQITVNSIFSRYLKEHCLLNNTEREYQTRKKRFETFILPHGNIPLANLNLKAVQGFLAHYRAEKQATAHNHFRAFIVACLNWAIQMGEIEYNVATPVKKMPTAPRSTVLTSEQIKEVLNGGDDDTNRVLKFMLFTGQRVEECLYVESGHISGHWWTCKQNKGQGVGVEKRIYLTDTALSFLGKSEGRCFKLKQQNGPAQYVARKYKGWIPKDIRRTVTTILASLGYSKDMTARFRGNGLDILETTYNRHQYDKELRQMALKLEGYLLKL